MTIDHIILLIIVCGIATFIIYGIWKNEYNNDQFSKQHGINPKYYQCVTKGDMYCTHTDWCDAEIALFPEQYEYEMKLKENDNQGDGKK